MRHLASTSPTCASIANKPIIEQFIATVRVRAYLILYLLLVIAMKKYVNIRATGIMGNTYRACLSNKAVGILLMLSINSKI
ncbi:MAG: hypothetical protein PHE15_03355 [Dehalococcoidales bacterium]|jgi:hypothetical protein|nr:hypothetical protein [Dehalococcoidales bacterium]